MDNKNNKTDSRFLKEEASKKDGLLTPEQRAERYLNSFKQEAPLVRKQILQSIEVVDIFADMDASTIEELTLEGIALDRGMLFDSSSLPLPACPYCGSINTKKVSGRNNLYLCKDCPQESKFATNINSITWRTHMSLLKWQKILYCVLTGVGVSKASYLCNINPKTFINARRKVFYALHIFLRKNFVPRLYGNIQLDETYFPISFRGYNLKKSALFPPTDDRYPQRLKPRDSKKRGGPIKGANPNLNNLAVCVITDCFGHTCSFYCGVGKPKYSTLAKYVDVHFLSSVPEKDPFPYAPNRILESGMSVGDKSYSICDAEPAITRFCREKVPMKNYSRVFRRDGIQVRARKNEKHINLQRVNRRHQELKSFIKSTGCSSATLRGYLLVYDFNKNTGGVSNKAALTQLMRILVEPGLFSSDADIPDFTSIPNFLFEWKDQDNILKKLDDKVLYAIYLMDRVAHPDYYPDEDPVSEVEIIELTQLSKEEIWSAYRDYTSIPGLRERILSYFNYLDSDNQDTEKQMKRLQNAINSIDQSDLALYDRYTAERVLPAHERLSLREVCDLINEKYGTTYIEPNARYKINRIVSLYLRPPLPELHKSNCFIYSYLVPDIGFQLVREYLQIIDEKQNTGEMAPLKKEVVKRLAENHTEYSLSTLLDNLSLAIKYLKYENPGWKMPEAGSFVNFPSSRELKNIAIESIYQKYMEFRENNIYSKKAEEAFFDGMISEYNLQLNHDTLKCWMLALSKREENPSLPPYEARIRVYDMAIPDAAIRTLEEYNRIAAEYVECGMKPPSFTSVRDEIQEILGLAPSTLTKYNAMARSYRKLIHPEEFRTPEEPDKPENFRLRDGSRAYGRSVSDASFRSLDLYNELIQGYIDREEDVPDYDTLIIEVHKITKRAPGTIKTDIIVARAARRNQSESFTMKCSKEIKLVLEEIYVGYVQFRLDNTFDEKCELAFFHGMIEMYQLDMSAELLKQQLYHLSNDGRGKKMPRYRNKKKASEISLPAKAYKAWDMYQALSQKAIAAGEKLPSFQKAAVQIAPLLGVSTHSIVCYLSRIKRLKEEQSVLNTED